MKGLKTALFVSALTLLWQTADAQKFENVRYGNFESWTIRLIRESGILGGETRTHYVIGPRDTIRANKPYSYNKTIWASSNTYAVVAGVTKVTCSVSPEKGPDGTCARLETKMVECKAAGIINIKVLAQGSIFWGRILEPISSTSNPYSNMDWGIPFTKKPSALVFDYKSVVPNSGKIYDGRKLVPGTDPETVMFILQHRWEDEDGNIHARRVGTAFCRIEKSSGKWIEGFRVPVIYGDARKSPAYRDYMGLIQGKASLYAVNGKGESKPILEEWGDATDSVTHAILSFTSGSAGSFRGELGNILWLDNIKLEYQ